MTHLSEADGLAGAALASFVVGGGLLGCVVRMPVGVGLCMRVCV